jgi:hypothetical protein
VNILKNDNKCIVCNLTIHPNFIGYHKCGYANCPICKNAIVNSGYWHHIRTHPGHENDSPPLPRKSFENTDRRDNKSYSDDNKKYSYNSSL